jgi:hypothetical protein
MSDTITTAGEFIFEAYKEQTVYLKRVVGLLADLVDALDARDAALVCIVKDEARRYLVAETDLVLKYVKK